MYKEYSNQTPRLETQMINLIDTSWIKEMLLCSGINKEEQIHIRFSQSNIKCSICVRAFKVYWKLQQDSIPITFSQRLTSKLTIDWKTKPDLKEDEMKI